MTRIVKKAREEAASRTSGKVVEREVIAASGEAARILEEAKAEAAEIVGAAQQARARAIQDGFKEGYERGAEQWQQAVWAARESIKVAVEQAKPQIVQLALRVAEKILRQKLDTTPEAMVTMVDEALRSLQGQNQMRVVLRVNPADQAVLELRRQRWMDRHPSITSLAIVADESFPRGGCRIESDFGTVDATLETQIGVIERHLLGGINNP
jgi:flagellar assembly protein FliH